MPNPDLSQIIAAARAKTEARPKAPDPAMIEAEMNRCRDDFAYFVSHYCSIYDNDEKKWIPFELWNAQIPALQKMLTALRLVILKARQLGLTWLALCYALWQMLFHPIAEVLVFSQAEKDAFDLLSDQRMRGMHDHLPKWMQGKVVGDNKGEFRFDNGSGIIALPASRGGDSHTLTLVIIDEADLIDNLVDLITRAKPTLGSHGQLFLISRAVKAKPRSYFKELYRLGRDKPGLWESLFLPWFARPSRTQTFYDEECESAMRLEGSLDSVYEQYPATDEEALAEASLSKRINGDWISKVFQSLEPITFPPYAPILTGLKIYRLPEEGQIYAMGLDPAQGDPKSDDSVACVIDAYTGEEVATFAGKIEPTVFAQGVAAIAKYYNNAAVLPERNNHGWTVIKELERLEVTIRMGLDGKKGWLNVGAPNRPGAGKFILYDTFVKYLSQTISDNLAAGQPIPALIHDPNTSSQLRSIDANTLSAPERYHDDYAMARVLAHMCSTRGVSSLQMLPHTGLHGDPNNRQPSALFGGMREPSPLMAPRSHDPMIQSPRSQPMTDTNLDEYLKRRLK